MNTNELYSIGETASLNDISVKSLRHYDEIGLLKPRYIDPKTGYRYYSYSQFSFIDKIKRYKNIGMSLKEIKGLFQDQNLTDLESFLKDAKLRLEEEKRLLQEKQLEVEWLSEFFDYSRSMQVSSDISVRYIEACHMLKVPCRSDDSMYAMDMELRRVAVSPEFKNCQILNPYGYILDYDMLLDKKISPTASTVCIHELPDTLKSPYLFTAPAGKYLCYRANILSDNWDITPLTEYCRLNSIKSGFVIALEYLASLYDPKNSPYEIRILIEE